MKSLSWWSAAIAAMMVVGCGGQSSTTHESTPEPAATAAPAAPPASGEVAIAITDRGFEPARPVVKKGEAVTLVFTRTTEQTCAVDVMFPRLGTKFDLPLNEAVRVDLPAGSVQDTLYFACTMNMITGMVTAAE